LTGGKLPVVHQNALGWHRPSGADSDEIPVFTGQDIACFVSERSLPLVGSIVYANNSACTGSLRES